VHSYQVDVESGQYLSVRVEQLGVDVVVDVYGPDNKLIEEFDAPTGDQGPEVASIVAETAGNYRIDIRSFEPDTAFGRYQIELREIRAGETGHRSARDGIRRISQKS
jgi:hypothetical protein